MEVRPVRVDELAAVAGLRWRWESELPPGPSVDREAFARRFVEWARQHSGSHHCIVAVLDGTVIGMAWLAVTARVPTPLSLERAAGDLQSVYLVPEERGKGVGGQLVEAVMDLARELGLMRVTVHSGRGAIPVYVRYGFEQRPTLLVAPVAR